MSVIYQVGPFSLDPEASVLTRDGIAAPLGPRAVAVLRTLVESADRYVPKARILDAAWPGLVVEEGNLAVQITAIRRVLAQVGGEHWIETLPRRGYRFIGPVVERTEDRQPLMSGRQSNLPAPRTSFVGRERELIENKRLLSTRRLLTLVGVGGIGKTRLALQLAAEVADAYSDGVWFVDLASLAEPALVPSAVAQTLGVREVAGKPLVETLWSHLRHRQLLLILDNCEHLLAAVAELAGTLLQQAAALTIVATSRERLGIAGEQVYALPPLSLPDPGADALAAERSEAVQLFVERARRQQPGFALTETRAPIIAQLCVRLDGIPLALELAAARIRSLSIEQIHARLDNRFKLLTAGGTALPRHQTLRATLDWSYDLLAEDERTALRRLSIFPGSFSTEAASAVASDAAIDGHAVIDLLTQLASRSLVVRAGDHDGIRSRLLETVRAYALEKLAEAGETLGVQRKHAQYFRDLFEHATDDWSRLPDAEWRRLYATEIDNVRTALEWAFGAEGDPDIGVGLCSGSGAIWLELSLNREGLRRLEGALGSVGERTPGSEQARLWFWLGLSWDSAPAKAVWAFEHAVDLYRRLDDPVGLGYSLAHLGSYLSFSGSRERALRVLAEALPTLERIGRPRVLAVYCIGLGFCEISRGNLSGARLHYEKAVSLCRESGAERVGVNALLFLADANWVSGDLDAALAGFREGALWLRRSGRRVMLGNILTNIAGVLTERGELAEALSVAREGLPLRSEAGQSWLAMDHLALRAALAGRIAHAARLTGFADSMNALKKWTRQPNEARARARLDALLREKLAADELERLVTEGAKMSEDEACRMALEA